MNKNIIALVFPALFLIGCIGGKESIKVELTAEDLAIYEGTTGQGVVDDAEALVIKAREEEFGVYVPGSLDEMEAELDKMRTMLLDTTTDFREIIVLKKSIELRFNQGMRVKGDVKTHLNPIIDQKIILDGMNAREVDYDEYSNLMDELGDLIELVQEGKIEKARGQVSDLLNEMLVFEIDVVKAVVLNPVKFLLESAESNDADEYAPRAFADAESAYKKARLFIDQNPRARDEIQQQGKNALYMAQRVMWITDRVIRFSSVNKSNWEAEVLAVEALFKPIMGAIDADKLGNLALAEQAEKIAESIQPELDKLRSAEKGRDKAMRELALAQGELEAEVEERKLLDIQVNEADSQKSELRSRVLALTRESERKSIKIRELNEALSLLQMPPSDLEKSKQPINEDANKEKSAGPKSAEPEIVEPEVVEPKAVEPEVVEPKAVEPEAVEPKAVEPEAVEPKAAEPKAAEPKAVEPVAVELKENASQDDQ